MKTFQFYFLCISIERNLFLQDAFQIKETIIRNGYDCESVVMQFNEIEVGTRVYIMWDGDREEIRGHVNKVSEFNGYQYGK